jgi:hypothetical protein
MIATLINLVIVLLIIGIIWWAVTSLLPVIPLPAPIAQVIHVLVMLIFALIVIFYVLIPLLHQAGVHTQF